MNANLCRLTTTLRNVLNPQPRNGDTVVSSWTVGLDADPAVTSTAPALVEHAALLRQGIGWKGVQLPQSPNGDSLIAIAASIGPGARRESHSDGGLPVRFMPFVFMPGVRRLDLSHSLGTVTGRAGEGTTGLVSSTTGAVGNTVRGIRQGTGAAVGGVDEDLGAAVGGVSQGVGNTVEGVGNTLENTLQSLGGKAK